jgi:spore coat polysaccharide biosynthesis protein SpsF
MKTGIIIQARTSSVRLPGKILKKLPYNSKISALEQVIRRAISSKKADNVIIATTDRGEDDIVVKIAENANVSYYRGDRDNVLERYYFAAKKYDIDLIVRITSDCPCIDPVIIDNLIDFHIDSGSDYTTNVLKRTFPHGMDAEAITEKVLEKAYIGATEHFEREHVTPYIYRSHPEDFRISIIEASGDLYRPDIRITLDTEEDYALLCAVFDYLYSKNNLFTVDDIVELFNQKPWLLMINKKIRQKQIFDTLDEELAEAIKILNLQDLRRAVDLLVHLQEN